MKSYTRKSIEEEYNVAAAAIEEFEMVKWGSSEKMYNRFRLALDCLDFQQIKNWLDVGAGTGAFQSVVCPIHTNIKATGIDISEQLIQYAKKRRDFGHENVRFVHCDFLDFDEVGFDLITCVGVLQKTNIPSIEFFNMAIEKLNPGGSLFLDTKNINWENFDEPGFYPETVHQWFSPSDLLCEAEMAKFKEIKIKGFLPGSNEIVEPNDSHTIFLTAKK